MRHASTRTSQTPPCLGSSVFKCCDDGDAQVDLPEVGHESGDRGCTLLSNDEIESDAATPFVVDYEDGERWMYSAHFTREGSLRVFTHASEDVVVERARSLPDARFDPKAAHPLCEPVEVVFYEFVNERCEAARTKFGHLGRITSPPRGRLPPSHPVAVYWPLANNGRGRWYCGKVMCAAGGKL